MTQPLGNCPDCGADEPFEQVHTGVCPDVVGDCPEWACAICGAGVIMGSIFMGAVGAVDDAEVEQSVRAA